jgi:hypothetical protein
MPNRIERVEIITDRERRRRYSAAEKVLHQSRSAGRTFSPKVSMKPR